MTVSRAQALHAAGIRSLEALAACDPAAIQGAMEAALPRNMRAVQHAPGRGKGLAAK